MLTTIFLFVVGMLWGLVAALVLLELVKYITPKIQERFAKKREWKETKEFIKKL